MLGADDAFVATMLVLAVGYTVLFVVDNVKQKHNLKEYETSFVQIHKDIIDKYQTLDQLDSSQNPPEDIAQHAEIHPDDGQHAEIHPDDGQHAEIPPGNEQPNDVQFAKWVSEKGFIKLNLKHHHKENLLKLCKSYYNLWTINRHVDNLFHTFFLKYDPKEEIQLIAFQKIEPPLKPVPIQVIRCNKKYAIIGIGDGNTDGYLLKAAVTHDPKNLGTVQVFNIYGKMTIKEEKLEEEKKKKGEKSVREANKDEGETSEMHAKDNVAHDDSKSSEEEPIGEKKIEEKEIEKEKEEGNKIEEKEIEEEEEEEKKTTEE